MNAPVAVLTAAYAAVAMLLLSLNLTSLWRWWVKAAAIIVTTIFFGVTYDAINGLMGWPTTQRPAGRFNFISSQIAEPDRRLRTPGYIYLWADDLDANNVPSGKPRSYQLPYTDALARKVADAQEKRDRGVGVMGKVADTDAQMRNEKSGDAKQGKMQNDKSRQSPATDTVPFKEDGSDLSFEDLPPVLLPEKDAM